MLELCGLTGSLEVGRGEGEGEGGREGGRKRGRMIGRVRGRGEKIVLGALVLGDSINRGGTEKGWGRYLHPQSLVGSRRCRELLTKGLHLGG